MYISLNTRYKKVPLKPFLLSSWESRQSMLQSESISTLCDFIFCIKATLFPIHAFFHACCALFSFTFYYPVQSGFYLLFSSVHLILFCCVFFKLSYFKMHNFLHCAMDTDREHKDVNSGHVMYFAHLHLDSVNFFMA